YRLSRPIELLQLHLKKMAEGEISDPLTVLKTEVVEIHALATAVEKVRDQMQQRIQVISIQKSEQDALLASMVEGVIAVDQNKIILHFNRAAGQIFRIESNDVIGKNIFEVVRTVDIIHAVDECLSKSEMLEKDIELEGQKKTYLQMHVSPMRMDSEFKTGVVMVFSDVSRLRELEGMRRNFVANVSHELRTPLTSIQGFAETLLNPAVKDPEQIKNFLQIIQRHASRLGRIIEDILTLSRIERDSENNQIEVKNEKIKSILIAAIELCHIKSEKKKINLSLSCADDLMGSVDPYLLEQAIVNLIDNAIRYSDEGKSIYLSAKVEANAIHISVSDEGAGIPEKQLPRIFERFYRVDKARSRELGGTGLGLSIVKHIALAHGGTVVAESQLGIGSVFAIILPLKKS
ncbi:MAG: ATP-binding protein, partial [Bdellovibrionales bacterium]